MRRVILCLVIVMTAFSVYSQSNERSDYQLLWKISGNGLKKPSFLFGTMHVRDNRAFDFSDSVLLALESCEAFAMEVHPDSVMDVAMETVLQADARKDNFREYLTEEEYNELDSLLSLKFDARLEDFKSPTDLSYKLMDRFEKKDKEIFLDLWLYNVALNEGKHVIGLETMAEQENASNIDMNIQVKKMQAYFLNGEVNVDTWYEQMFEVYQAGDLNKLRKISKDGSSAGSYQAMVTNRNLVMARRITEAIRAHNTFIAVGAAHLPGEEGLIHLLQKRGFKVTRVKATFTGMAAAFQQTKSKRKWITYTSHAGAYAIEMPHEPKEFNVPNLGILFQTSIDLGTQSFYMTSHFPYSAEFKGKPHELLEGMTNSFSNQSNSEVDSIYDIEVDGHQGRELQMYINGQYFRTQVIVGDQMLYFLMAGPTPEIAHSENGKRFFNSFKLLDFSADAKVQELVDNDGAFSLSMPPGVNKRTLTPEDGETKRPYQIHVGFSIDPNTGESFVYRYNDFITGYTSLNDSIFLAQSLESIVSSMKAENLVSRHSTYKEYPALDFSLLSNTNVDVNGRLILRGNRFYLVMATGEKNSDSTSRLRFVNSLKFNSYTESKLKEVEISNGTFLNLPVNFAADSTTKVQKEGSQYSFIDRASGTMLTLKMETLNPYTEAVDEEKYFNDLVEKLYYADSVFDKHIVNAGDLKGAEYFLKGNFKHATKRIRFFVAGDQLITLWAASDPAAAKGKFLETVFQSLRIHPRNNWRLNEDKTSLLLKDLLSNDSLVRQMAAKSILLHSFKNTDVPQLLSALKVPYTDDADEYRATRRRLLTVLRNLNDERVAASIGEIYPTFPVEGKLRDVALSVITSTHTKSGIDQALDLIARDPSEYEFDAGEIFDVFYDSIELLNDALPRLLQLQSRFTDRMTIFKILNTAIEGSALTTDMQRLAIDESLKWAKEVSEKPLLSKDDSKYYQYLQERRTAVQILGSFPFSEPVGILLRQFTNGDDVNTMWHATTALLKNKIKVPSPVINKIAADVYYRIDIYKALQTNKQTNLIEKKYRTPLALAESLVDNYFSDTDEYPDTVVFHSMKKITVGKIPAELYVFNFKYGEEEYRLAVAPLNAKKPITTEIGEWVNPFYEKVSDEKEFDQTLDALLEKSGMKLSGRR